MALGGGAGYAAGHSKQSSALDECAAELAVKTAAENGWDAEEAGERVASVITLGICTEENSKVAAAGDLDGAVQIRSLEFLEAAGYPVTWGEGQ